MFLGQFEEMLKSNIQFKYVGNDHYLQALYLLLVDFLDVRLHLGGTISHQEKCAGASVNK